VRRSQHWKLLLILIVTGVLPAAAVTLVFHELLRLILSADALTQLSTWLLVLGVFVEFSWVRFRLLRPLSVNRQVPQSWGHEHGPWKAALRYGPRLGVGPATILTSWTWWFGFFFAAGSGPYACIAFSLAFVFVRSALTIVIPGNPANGLDLAHTMSRFRCRESTMKWSGAVVLGIAAGLALLGVQG
jgi:hypothetical protein